MILLNDYFLIDRISLSCFDNKRFVLNAEIYTLAYFHKEVVMYMR